MNETDWLYLDCPIESPNKTHIYIKKPNRGFVRRCDTSIKLSEEELCRVSESEYESLLDGKEEELCANCLRFQTHLTP